MRDINTIIKDNPEWHVNSFVIFDDTVLLWIPDAHIVGRLIPTQINGKNVVISKLH